MALVRVSINPDPIGVSGVEEDLGNIYTLVFVCFFLVGGMQNSVFLLG